MSTRAQIRFATREVGISFSDHPVVIHAQFYNHSDGYPEGLGVNIAESLTKYKKICGWEVEPLHTKHADLEYIYYVWQHPMKDTWISIFAVKPFVDNSGECIFVGTPEQLIKKYKQNTNNDG